MPKCIYALTLSFAQEALDETGDVQAGSTQGPQYHALPTAPSHAGIPASRYMHYVDMYAGLSCTLSWYLRTSFAHS